MSKESSANGNGSDWNYTPLHPEAAGAMKTTYLAVIDHRDVGFAGGFVKELPAAERTKLWQHEGPWPNHRIIGEFGAAVEARYAVHAYCVHNASGWNAWFQHKKRRRGERRARLRKTATLSKQ